MIQSESIPEKERYILDKVKSLSSATKLLFMDIIKDTSKDGVCVYNGDFNENICELTEKEIIVKNPLYKGEGISFFVLSQAPYLLRKMVRYSELKKDKTII
ncbi:hypothetical protein [Bacillus cereus group sp. TH152-1LC]|uniref:hypothetical protein n=1 Tax=Bacillus cereus group sp. TH152-1LC TaxID=3018060 RepID=UPI0022E3CA9C|nr:hypothetical protein [Bacillus cereus group sp. TH152-1LC]MDA1675731.1 hypothetical protein [Bacillus cereus group sp. TH152-1LC]